MDGIVVLAQVSGRVQGVGYRAWVHGRAIGHGLRGWVRNEPDGSVTALLAGPEPAVEEMLEAMQRGPRAARVDAMTRSAAGAETLPKGFEIRR